MIGGVTRWGGLPGLPDRVTLSAGVIIEGNIRKPQQHWRLQRTVMCRPKGYVFFLRRFGLKTGIDFSQFWSGI